VGDGHQITLMDLFQQTCKAAQRLYKEKHSYADRHHAALCAVLPNYGERKGQNKLKSLWTKTASHTL